MTKVNNFQTEQAKSLADHTEDIYLNLVLDYEKDSSVFGNLITVTVETEYKPVKFGVIVTLADTVETVKDRFDSQFNQFFDEQESYERYERDNYEHASATQGYSFDRLTC